MRHGAQLSGAEHNALMRIRQAVHGCPNCAAASSAFALGKILAERHRFIVVLRTGRPEGFQCLGHSFLLVQLCSGGPAIVVDAQFRERFQYAAMPDGSYAACVAALPRVFIGTLQGVSSVVSAMSDALHREASARGHQLPPWRSREALYTNWLPPRFTDDVIMPPGAALHPVLLHTSHMTKSRPSESECSASGPSGPAPNRQRTPDLAGQPAACNVPSGATLGSSSSSRSGHHARANSLTRSFPQTDRHDAIALTTTAPDADAKCSPLAGESTAPWCVVVRGFSNPGCCSNNTGCCPGKDSRGGADCGRPADTCPAGTAGDSSTCLSSSCTSDIDDGDSGVCSGTGGAWAAADGGAGLKTGRKRTAHSQSQSGAVGSSCSVGDAPRTQPVRRVSGLTLSLTAAGTVGGQHPQVQKQTPKQPAHEQQASQGRRPQASQGFGSGVEMPRTVVRGMLQHPAKRVGSPSSPVKDCGWALGPGAVNYTGAGYVAPAPAFGSVEPALKQQPAADKASELAPCFVAAAPVRTAAVPYPKWDAMPRIVTVRPAGVPRLVRM